VSAKEKHLERQLIMNDSKVPDKTTSLAPKPVSLLDKARNEGYADGWSQAAMIAYDDAYMKGEESARKEAPKRLQWFILGFTVAVLLSDLIHRYF
jgi:hypothetical protein